MRSFPPLLLLLFLLLLLLLLLIFILRLLACWMDWVYVGRCSLCESHRFPWLVQAKRRRTPKHAQPPSVSKREQGSEIRVLRSDGRVLVRVEFSRTSCAILRWQKQWVQKKSNSLFAFLLTLTCFSPSLGIDPSSNLYVPFNITNKTYAQNLYRIMLAPLEEQV